jgi:rod shape-determining protein MreC
MDVLGQDRREGLGRKAESRVSLLTLFIVSVLLLLSSLYSAEASVFRKARETVIDVAAGPLSFFAGPISYIQNVVGDVQDYFNVLEKNQALREENAELRQWMNDALALREIVAAYEDLGSYKAPPQAEPINAFVIGESNDAFVHSMLVNAGRGDGVERGLAVVDDHGLIGRIVDVGDAASRILLLTDIQSRIPVYVEEANVEGLLVGRTKARPAISFTESSEPAVFAPGQRVLTSGAGGVLPRGLPVGVVAEDRDGEAIVKLFANYARTRMVRVINYEFPLLEAEVEEATTDAEDAEVVGQAAAPPPEAEAVGDEGASTDEGVGD